MMRAAPALVLWAATGCIVGRRALDRDDDGFVAAAAGGEDCDDSDPGVHPDRPEVCGDGIDNNCDGLTDDAGEGAVSSWPDRDRDGYGAVGEPSVRCTPPPGYVTRSDDCDDTRDTSHPGRTSDPTCDGLDDDCDGAVDEDAPDRAWFWDDDHDGYGGQPTPPACQPPAGAVAEGGDCNDGDPTVHPGANDGCNGIDDDCDGTADGPVMGSAPACPAPSCAVLARVRPDQVPGVSWIGEADLQARLRCLPADDGGDAWTVLGLTAAREHDLVTFTVEGSTEAQASWQGTQILLDPGTQSALRCEHGEQNSLVAAELSAPHAFTRVRSMWTLQPHIPDARFDHVGQDTDGTPGWGALSPCGDGAVRYGTEHELLKPGGTWGPDWSGPSDQPRELAESPILLSSPQRTLRWELVGGALFQPGGAVLSHIEVHVR